MINKLPRLILTLFVAGTFFCSILPFAEPVSVIHKASCPLSDPGYAESLNWGPPEIADHAREICERERCNQERRPDRWEPGNEPPPSNNEPPPSNNEPPPSNNEPPTDNGQTTNDNAPDFSVYLSAFGSILFLLFCG